MSSTHEAILRPVGLSPAMLAMLLGAGGLFVIWKFDFLFYDHRRRQIVLLGGAHCPAVVGDDPFFQ